MLSSLEILILSMVQGISEFLPVSSAAHLFLISQYYAFNNQNLLIDICLHLGSLIAIITYFIKDLINFINNKNFLIKILIATIPLIPAGYIIYQTGLIDKLRNLESFSKEFKTLKNFCEVKLISFVKGKLVFNFPNLLWLL